MNQKFDKKLISNMVDEVTRLNEQLVDLEKYRSEVSDEEYIQIKKETLDQLVEKTQILNKMKTGDMTTLTQVEEAQIVKYDLII